MFHPLGMLGMWDDMFFGFGKDGRLRIGGIVWISGISTNIWAQQIAPVGSSETVAKWVSIAASDTDSSIATWL